MKSYVKMFVLSEAAPSSSLKKRLAAKAHNSTYEANLISGSAAPKPGHHNTAEDAHRQAAKLHQKAAKAFHAKSAHGTYHDQMSDYHNQKADAHKEASMGSKTYRFPKQPSHPGEEG